MSLPRFRAWISWPLRRPSPAATISTIETMPQAIPNMVRNVRSLCAQRVRTTSPMRLRRTIADLTRELAGREPYRSLSGDTFLDVDLLHGFIRKKEGVA